MKATIKENGDLEVRDHSWYSLLLSSVVVLAGGLFIVFSSISISRGSLISSEIAPILAGLLFIAMGLIPAIYEDKFIFKKGTNEVSYFYKGKHYITTKYYHIDLVKNLNYRGIPSWDAIIFIKHDKSPILRINYIEFATTAQEIKKYCLEVLRNTTNYRPPEQTLEELTQNNTNIGGAISSAIMAIARSLGGG